MIFAQGLEDQDTISQDISVEEKYYKVLALGACQLQGTKQTLIQAMAYLPTFWLAPNTKVVQDICKTCQTITEMITFLMVVR